MTRPSPPVHFTSVRANRQEQPAGFSVVGGDGRIEFHGALSVGSLGWTLSAVASWRRNVIDLFVTARQVEAQDMPGLEDYDYKAVIEVPPGLYQLRLKHIYILPNTHGVLSGLRIFQHSVRVR